MCIIVGLNPKITVKKNILQNCWNVNSDGAGFSYQHSNEVIIEKGFMSFDEFYEVFQFARAKFSKSYFLIHFRKVSRGEKNKENCHPFYTHDKKIAIAHNGTITQINDTSVDSDTNKFAKMLGCLSEKWIDNNIVQKLIHNFIGTDRLAVLTAKQLYIFNESAWTQLKGIYFSNNTYKTPATYNNSDKTPTTNNFIQYKTCPHCNTYLLTTEDEIKNNICFTCKNKTHLKIEDKTIKKCTCCKIELQYTFEKDRNLCDACIQQQTLYTDY